MATCKLAYFTDKQPPVQVKLGTRTAIRVTFRRRSISATTARKLLKARRYLDLRQRACRGWTAYAKVPATAARFVIAVAKKG